MAELTIDPASVRKALDDFVQAYKPSDTPTQEVGYVVTAGDGIAHVSGLPGCMANELLTFEDGTQGLAFNLDAREIGVVILGPAKCSPCPWVTAIWVASSTPWAARWMAWARSKARVAASLRRRLLT